MGEDTKRKVSEIFEWAFRVTSVLSVFIMSYGGLYIYKHDIEFESKLDGKYVHQEAAKYFYDSRDVELVSRDVVDQFKTKTNTAIANIKSEADVHEATIAGILTRLERDVSEMRQDIRQLVRAKNSTSSIDSWVNDEEWIAKND